MTYKKADAIAAISTPQGVGGCALVRMTGKDAITVADRFFKNFRKVLPSDMQGYTSAYGDIIDIDGNKVDSVVLTVFREPYSYTGENTVEISCHGGLFVTREVLRSCLDYGCTPAGPGEFTKRAFLNGKMTLNQAESVLDIIDAGSKAELKIANILRSGRTSEYVEKIRENLVNILGRLSVWADYPDDDVPEIDHESLADELHILYDEMKHAYKTYDYGKKIKNGIPTVIAGRPNVGKSTLFNLLVGEKRSIVTDIAGTTRDVVEEHVQIGDISLKLWDTAGIRETSDEVEKIGVEIAYNKLDEAQLVLFLLDSSAPIEISEELVEKLKDKTVIAVLNKSDLNNDVNTDEIKKLTDYIVSISAKEKTGIDELEALLKQLYFDNEISPQNGWIANERQRDCLASAMNCVQNAIEETEKGEFLDIVTVILDEALDFLLKLTGEKVTDSVVDEVFSKFCVGK
mgnify:FL=1